MAKHLLTYHEVASQLGVSLRWARRLVQNRTLPMVKLGPKCARFRQEDVDQLVVSKMVRGPKPERWPRGARS